MIYYKVFYRLPHSILFSIPVVSTTRDAYAYDSEWRWRNTEHLTWIPKAKNLCNDVLPSISNIIMPDKETLVSDAGKLSVLDGLLVKLKAEGHRVLIYSQMTRMNASIIMHPRAETVPPITVEPFSSSIWFSERSKLRPLVRKDPNLTSLKPGEQQVGSASIPKTFGSIPPLKSRAPAPTTHPQLETHRRDTPRRKWNVDLTNRDSKAPQI